MHVCHSPSESPAPPPPPFPGRQYLGDVPGPYLRVQLSWLAHSGCLVLQQRKGTRGRRPLWGIVVTVVTARVMVTW
jgi:hypothetical protein